MLHTDSDSHMTSVCVNQFFPDFTCQGETKGLKERQEKHSKFNKIHFIKNTGVQRHPSLS